MSLGSRLLAHASRKRLVITDGSMDGTKAASTSKGRDTGCPPGSVRGSARPESRPLEPSAWKTATGRRGRAQDPHYRRPEIGSTTTRACRLDRRKSARCPQQTNDYQRSNWVSVQVGADRSAAVTRRFRKLIVSLP
jgi:hypothetical protein